MTIPKEQQIFIHEHLLKLYLLLKKPVHPMMIKKIVFKLSDHRKLYCEHLEKFGEDSSVVLHSSRFTDRLLHYLPDFEAHNSKSGTILTLKNDIGNTLLDACNKDSDDTAILLMRVSKMIRKEMFQQEQQGRSMMKNMTIYLIC